MKVIEFDERRMSMRVVPETTDDLWVLYTVINPGDYVIAKTLREVKGEGQEGKRLPMVLKLKVEKLEFQQFTDRLRISGVIIEGPEKFGLKGSHHTINLGVNQELIIVKEKWSEVSIKRLREASKVFEPIMLVSTDYEDYSIAILYRQGIQILEESSLNLSKREENIIEENAEKLAKKIISYCNIHKVKLVVIAGPGRFKEIVAGKLSNIKVIIDNVSHGGRVGINELVKRESLSNAIRDYELHKASLLMDKFFELLSKDDRYVAYGMDQIKIATEMGAVEHLIVLDSLLSDYEAFSQVEEILREVDRKKGSINILPERSDIGSQLKALGGIVAILRFPIT